LFENTRFLKSQRFQKDTNASEWNKVSVKFQKIQKKSKKFISNFLGD